MNREAIKIKQNAPVNLKYPRIRVKENFERIFRNMYIIMDRALRHDAREQIDVNDT